MTSGMIAVMAVQMVWILVLRRLIRMLGLRLTAASTYWNTEPRRQGITSTASVAVCWHAGSLDMSPAVSPIRAVDRGDGA